MNFKLIFVEGDSEEMFTKNAFEEFKSIYPNVEIVLLKDSEISEFNNMDISQADNSLWPTAYYHQFWHSANEDNYVSKNKDITDMLKKTGWLDKMSESIRSTISDDNGRIYSLPYNVACSFGLICNIELFEEAGLTDMNGVPVYPKTWEEFIETAAKIKAATGREGFFYPTEYAFDASAFAGIANSFGSESFYDVNTDGKYTSNLDSENTVSAMEFLKSLRWEHEIITEDSYTEDSLFGYKYVGNGSAAMIIGANDALEQVVMNGLPADKVGFCALPSVPNQKNCSPVMIDSVDFPSYVSDEQIEAVLTLLELAGHGPVFNDAKKALIVDYASDLESAGVPVIFNPQIWNSPEVTELEERIIEKSKTTNNTLYKSFYEAINNSEEFKIMLADNAAVYAAGKAVNEVLNNKDADVSEIIKQASKKHQQYLDEWNKN
ncbi:MAG: extracellular solute-binding protein [Lachnospiraceae bacterium]|nr:extracellular solute-binding protein [Lachnospiraceae bacterium]